VVEHGLADCVHSKGIVMPWETCSLICNAGYIATPGRDSTTCQEGGHWSTNMQCQVPMETIDSTTDHQTQKSLAYCAIQSDIGRPEGAKMSNGIVTYEKIISTMKADETNISFNQKTGKFTANVTGVYSFSASAASAQTEKDAYLVVNLKTSSGANQDEKEKRLMGLSSDGTNKLKTSLFGTRLVSMKKGDELWLEYSCDKRNGSCGIDKLHSCVMLIEPKEEKQRDEIMQGTCGFQDWVDTPENGHGLIEYTRTTTETKIGNGTIIYDQTNQGQLSNSTGRFTADQTGVYSVSASAFVGRTTNKGKLDVYLRTSSGKHQDNDEARFMLQYVHDASNLHASLSTTRMQTLHKGEQLWLEYKCTEYDEDDNCAIEGLHFCIFLVERKEEVSTNRVAVNSNEMENQKDAHCGHQRYVESDGVIQYDRAYGELSSNSMFDKDTGKFTAGVKGVYQVSVSAVYQYTFEDAEIQVYLKTSSMINQDDDDDLLLNQVGDGTEELVTPVSASRLVKLERSEQLWLEYNCTGTYTCYIGGMNTCIYLLAPLDE